MRFALRPLARFAVIVAMVVGAWLVGGEAASTRGVAPTARPSADLDPSAPVVPVKLIFIHHSTGEAWLHDSNGGLALALRDNNYFVSDTNYGWGPDDEDLGYDTIGDHTDIPHWYSWFTGPHRSTYLAALYAERDRHSDYSRSSTDPGGANTVIMFKSCFPNSNLDGNPNDPPAATADYGSDLTVANAKRIYLDMLSYFGAHQEKLFVVIAAPPLRSVDTWPEAAANARAFNNWLVNDWLTGYAHPNVAVFDFFTVLTSNGGSANINDLGSAAGNHHRYRAGAIEHITTQATNYLAYPTGDSHPSKAGNLKATGEFVTLLNIYYNRWKGGGAPAPTVSAVTPRFGPIGGGTVVTVTGTGFAAGAVVGFGGTPATDVTVVSASSITARTPAHAVGTVDVVVTNPGAQVGTLSDGYTFVGPLPSFTDDPLQARTTPVRVVHLTELRARVDALRARYGLVAMGWTDPVVSPGATSIRGVHLTELRSALAGVYAAAGLSAPVYTDGTLTAGATAVAAVHIAELRAAITNIW